MSEYIVGVTGASGSIYALYVIDGLLNLGHSVRLVLTDAGMRVLEYETGEKPAEWAAVRGVRLEDNKDLFSAIASGSYQSAGMVVAPCSMSTLGRLANGITTDLLARAADATLKQNRPLVLVPRETPLTAIHLQNMLTLAQCGARIVPAMPGFYGKPQTLSDLAGFMAGKILDSLGLDNKLYHRWEDHQ